MVYGALLGRFGRFTADLFASWVSKRCKEYYTRDPTPGAAGTDAFAIRSWAAFARRTPSGQWRFPYINPPFHLLPRVMAKLAADHATAVVVFPLWRSASWWPLLLAPASAGEEWSDAIRDLLIFPRGKQHYENRNTTPVIPSTELSVLPKPPSVPPSWGLAAALISFSPEPPARPADFSSRVRDAFQAPRPIRVWLRP
jgi:hypothetical protein